MTRRRDLILATVDDLVTDLFVYDRKDDDDLGLGEIEAAIDAGEITIDEILAAFRDALAEHAPKGTP